jgi:hypothetical protein
MDKGQNTVYTTASDSDDGTFPLLVTLLKWHSRLLQEPSLKSYSKAKTHYKNCRGVCSGNSK